ncbi:hypothetical protein [Carboxylicivirga sp. N1Y90]|uniref:hypothetical protein n=1 Tax=Carboxylicivirga fragile TaxID=3417571 RepID=UPI003D33E3EB|nr:hypothetical protein [Marinilabiliaceae bacterium N1Y90]
MNKKKAVKILQGQINKLERLEFPTTSWIKETQSYIELFFKPESQPIYDSIYQLNESSGDCKTFIESCKSIIKDCGVYKDPKKNLFSTLPNWAVALLFLAVGYVGHLSKYLTNSELNSLKSENLVLKQTIDSFSTIKPPTMIHNEADNNPANVDL